MLPPVFAEEIRRIQPRVPLGQISDQSEFTGERFLPGYMDGSIDLQHIHRYSFALQFVLGKTVLDIACGEGYGSELLGQAASEVIGVDIDDTIVDVARKRYTRPNLSFRKGSATAIPLEDRSVDVIVSFETIEHLADQNTFWCEIKRVLKKAGVLIISSPNRDVYNQERPSKNPFHVRELSREELVYELSQRFSYHQLFSQANVFGSFIMPVSAEPITHSVISIEPATRVLTWQVGDDLRDPFSVAVASDEFQSSTGQSLYTGGYPPDAMASLTGGIVERDLLLRDLRRQIADLEISRGEMVEAAQHERDEAIQATKQVEESLSALLIQAQRERDEDMRAAKRVEENLLKEKQLLIVERDQAIKRTKRVTETLAEQDGVIEALRTLVDEYIQRSVASGAVESIEHTVPSENGR